jgi:hypothetical protein
MAGLPKTPTDRAVPIEPRLDAPGTKIGVTFKPNDGALHAQLK